MKSPCKNNVTSTTWYIFQLTEKTLFHPSNNVSFIKSNKKMLQTIFIYPHSAKGHVQ